MLRIGLSSCFFHADPMRPVFKGKTLLYCVQDMSDWVQSEGVLALPIPTPPPNNAVTLESMVRELDGLVLQGGSDVSPRTYGEEPLKPEWGGDAVRDRYEIALVQEFMRQGKPVLGICRGLQLLNVAFGGTLYQDIGTQCPGALNHRDWQIYDQNFHSIEIEPGSTLGLIYGAGKTERPVCKVNTVHHQAIKVLGKNLVAEAYSIPDRIIEAIRGTTPSYVLGVQWHPEFQDPADASLLPPKPLIQNFLKEVRMQSPSARKRSEP